MTQIIRITGYSELQVEGVVLSTNELVSFQYPQLRHWLIGWGHSGIGIPGVVIEWEEKGGPTRYLADWKYDLLVDVHQPESWLPILKVLKAVPLFSGDVCWETNQGLKVGIEVKLGADLYSSCWIQNTRGSSPEARLAHQIPNLVSCYDIPILLVDLSTISCTPDGMIQIWGMGDKGVMGRQWSSMWNTLLGYQLRYPKLKLWVAKRAFRVPEDILKIRSYLNKPEHNSQMESPTALLKTFKEDLPPQWAWLAALVGPHAAKKAGEVYPNLWDLLSSNKKDLLKIPGWGPKTAAKVIDCLGRKKHEH